MNKNSPEIAQLRIDIESEINHKVRTPYDFDSLSGAIWERMHENLSTTTLKRLWGYISGADNPNWTTLCILSQFLGYKDWADYLHQLSLRDDVESELFQSNGIHADQLLDGDEIEVTWLPNRCCRFRYEGNRSFIVTEVQNAKLHVGDRFSAVTFVIGRPMYLDNVKEGTSYIAGKRNGILTVKKL